MSMQQIVTLVEFYLKNTYFLFQGKYYEQVNDAAMGSPLAPSLATCLWKSLKSRSVALSHTPLAYG